MPCFIREWTPAGLRPVAYGADSLAQAAVHEPHDGVYTVTNTYNTFQVLRLDAHLDRLEDSAQRSGIPLRLDRPALRGVLRAMIAEAGYGDVRFRVTVPRATPDRLTISLEPYTPPPPALVERGVRCITLPHSARADAVVKSTAWMHDRHMLEERLPEGVYTGLLLDEEGAILEGISSNFYAVLDGELRSAATGVLPGIAQQIVYAIAPAVLPLRRDAVHTSDLLRLSEAFITSSSRGIIPVVEIDGVTISTGTPGEHTRALMTAYRAWVAQHLEPL